MIRAIVSLVLLVCLMPLGAFAASPSAAIIAECTAANGTNLSTLGWTTALNQGWEVQSNRCVPNSTANFQGSFYSTALPSTNMELYATIITPPAADTVTTLIYRAQTTGFTDYYELRISPVAGTQWYIASYSTIADSPTFITSVDLGSNYVSGDQIWVTVVGTHHTVYYNGAVLYSFDNSAITTGTYVGLLAPNTANVVLDAIGAGSLLPSAARRRHAQ